MVEVASSLAAQDEVLARLENKLDTPVLNGGFDTLMARVEKMEGLQQTSNVQVDRIHTAVFDPDDGLYVKTKATTHWINNVNKGSKWLIALFVTGLMTGVGWALYDTLVQTHIH